MVVSVPVKVAVVEPGYLYRGDTYYFAATVSGNTDGPVKGKFYLYTYPGSDHKHLEPVSVQRSAISLAPHGTASVKFPVTAPSGVDTLGLKAVFVAEGGDEHRTSPASPEHCSEPGPQNSPVKGAEENELTANVPVGFGVKYKFRPRWNVGLDWSMRFTLSDKLDGIEDPYKVKSGFLKNKDSYSWTMVYISYDLCPKYRKCAND